MNGRLATTWPWRDSDVTLVAITAMLGLIAILVAWFGASGTSSLTRQVLWANVAFAGFAVSSVGLCLWLMRGRRVVGERRVALVCLDAAVPQRSAARPHTVTRPGAREGSELVRVPGTRRVHVLNCPLIAGKEAEPVAPGVGERCGVCLP